MQKLLRSALVVATAGFCGCSVNAQVTTPVTPKYVSTVPDANLPNKGSAGSCGDATHSCQLTFDAQGRETARSQVAISGGGGAAKSSTSGPLSGLPATCAIGDVYFATDQPANQQLYTCSALNTQTQIGLLGGSGALSYSSGALDVTSQVPLLANANTWTGFNNFSGAQFRPPERAFGSLPAAASNTGKVFIVTNASDSGSCNGSGAVASWCRSDGTNWVALGGNGGRGEANSVTQIVDTNGAPTVKSGAAVTSAVNYVEATNAATGGFPLLASAGTGADIPLRITYKGTSGVHIGGNSGNSSFNDSSINVNDHANATPGVIVNVPSASGNGKFCLSFLGGAGCSFIWDTEPDTGVQRMRSSANGFLVTIDGHATFDAYSTKNNCASSASPAVCGSASAGRFVVAASATTVTVNTSAVKNNSEVFLQFDSSLGTALGVTCNITYVAPWVSARVDRTSFTITVAAPSTNPACFSYHIMN